MLSAAVHPVQRIPAEGRMRSKSCSPLLSRKGALFQITVFNVTGHFVKDMERQQGPERLTVALVVLGTTARGSESSRRARACDCPSALASREQESLPPSLSLSLSLSRSLSLSLSLSRSRCLRARELSDEERRLVKAAPLCSSLCLSMAQHGLSLAECSLE